MGLNIFIIFFNLYFIERYKRGYILILYTVYLTFNNTSFHI